MDIVRRKLMLVNINTYFSLRAKCWLGLGGGGVRWAVSQKRSGHLQVVKSSGHYHFIFYFISFSLKNKKKPKNTVDMQTKY